MGNKCPNCGYNYNDNDAFCAMCGAKLEIFEPEIESEKDIQLKKSKEKTLKYINNFMDKKPEKGNTKSHNFKKNLIDSTLFNFIAIMFLVSFIMCVMLYCVIYKQDTKKLEMRYENMLSNPALIPELKEPQSFYELKTNLESCEKFLELYLGHSDDTQEKKEQVFISYLKEMEKLPHITNENMVKDDLDNCSVIKSSQVARKCAKNFSADFSSVGIKAYPNFNTVYLYPDYAFISKKYSKYLSKGMNKYLKLKAKYNCPVSVGLEMQLKPKRVADKIYDFEKLYTQVSDVYIRDEVLKTIYNDFRVFIFSPSIYATTTQEMTKEFKNAYNYFIKNRRNSQLRPLIMSYLDKKRAYDETNFKNDYPYKTFESDFNENVLNSSLGDIFVQLRKNLFADKSQSDFSYVYSITSTSWKAFDKSKPLNQGDYIFSVPDENNDIMVYNNTYSLLQELNLPKYSRLFLVNNMLYVFNSDRLSFSKIIFNGRLFNLQQQNISDASGMIPGVHIINIDSYQNYNINVEKYNTNAVYIILSRYSQGFDGYHLTALKGQIAQHSLPNVFSVSSNSDVEIAFHHSSVNPKETSESTPTYRITIRTNGSKNEPGVVNYDEQTARESDSETHNPVMMPKITLDEDDADSNESNNKSNKDTGNLMVAPAQNIEPPAED